MVESDHKLKNNKSKLQDQIKEYAKVKRTLITSRQQLRDTRKKQTQSWLSLAMESQKQSKSNNQQAPTDEEARLLAAGDAYKALQKLHKPGTGCWLIASKGLADTYQQRMFQQKRYLDKAIIHYKASLRKGNFNKPIECANQKQEPLLFRSLLYRNVGVTIRKRAMYGETHAVSLALALQLLNKAKQQLKKHPVQWAKTLVQIAKIQTLQRQYKRAYRNLKRAQTILTQKKTPMQWALMQDELGLVQYFQAKRAPKNEFKSRMLRSIAHFRKALTHITMFTWPSQWSRVQYNLGAAYLELGEKNWQAPYHFKARRTLEKAKEYYEHFRTSQRGEAIPLTYFQFINNYTNALRDAIQYTPNIDKEAKRILALYQDAIKSCPYPSLRSSLVYNKHLAYLRIGVAFLTNQAYAKAETYFAQLSHTKFIKQQSPQTKNFRRSLAQNKTYLSLKWGIALLQQSAQKRNRNNKKVLQWEAYKRLKKAWKESLNLRKQKDATFQQFFCLLTFSLGHTTLQLASSETQPFLQKNHLEEAKRLYKTLSQTNFKDPRLMQRCTVRAGRCYKAISTPHGTTIPKDCHYILLP